MDPVTIGGLFTLGKELIGRVWPDPEAQARELRALEKLHQEGKLAELQARVQLLQGQLEINKQEAKHSSLFVAGWRPYVGWMCGTGLGYAAIIDPLMRFIASVNGYTGEFPEIDTAVTVQVLLGMLGMATLRQRDKEKKTAG